MKAKTPAPADWRKLPRTRHTRDLEALRPGESLFISKRLATTARMAASRLGKRPGRKYRSRLVPGGRGRVEIYREA